MTYATVTTDLPKIAFQTFSGNGFLNKYRNLKGSLENLGNTLFSINIKGRRKHITSSFCKTANINSSVSASGE